MMSMIPQDQERAIVARKKHASILSLGTNVFLTIIKTAAAAATGSVSLFSESIHSATDVVASTITYFSVKVASAPPDDEHPYGHGKIESLASFAESILLVLIVGFIFKESAERLTHGTQVQHLSLGSAVMAFSATVSLGVGLNVRRIGQESDSAALRSNSNHLIIDFWTSVGVFAALLVSHLTGWHQADSWFAIGLGFWILWSAFHIGREAVQQLIDRRISDDEMETIHAVLKGIPNVISYHRLRTRHIGNIHYIEVHVVVPNTWTVIQGHSMADEVEATLERAIVPSHVMVHIDPFDPLKAQRTQEIGA